MMADPTKIAANLFRRAFHTGTGENEALAWFRDLRALAAKGNRNPRKTATAADCARSRDVWLLWNVEDPSDPAISGSEPVCKWIDSTGDAKRGECRWDSAFCIELSERRACYRRYLRSNRVLVHPVQVELGVDDLTPRIPRSDREGFAVLHVVPEHKAMVG